MGLIVPQTVKVRTNASNYKRYKEKGYTFKKCGDFIEVNVLDLPKSSSAKVKIICDVCGKESETSYGYIVKCNEENELITCGSNSCKYKKSEYTCMKKYGVKSSTQLQEVQNKMKATNLERYGCESATQNEEIKNKIKETNLERYGCICSLQSEEIKKKAKKTWQEKYGENITNPLQVESIKNKIKETNLERYGYEYASQSEEVKKKTKETMMKRYGVDNPSKSQKIKDKMKKTWQEKYGENITNPLQVESIKNKMKATNLKRYGHECVLQSEEVKKKTKETMLKRYGTEKPMQNEEIQNKIKSTNNKIYGGDSPFSSEEIRKKSKQTLQEKYGKNITNPMQVEDIKNKILSSFQFNGTGPSSRAQRYINYILNGTLNKHICGSLADIYMEKENIIIEYDGSGHFLGDKMNGNIYPTKESLLYEKEREDKIINNGYRMIRFIATKDRIPSDEIILNLIEEFKNSDFKVIRIDFEESTIEKDYNEKLRYDFGELRKITQKDLEQFEK